MALITAVATGWRAGRLEGNHLAGFFRWQGQLPVKPIGWPHPGLLRWPWRKHSTKPAEALGQSTRPLASQPNPLLVGGWSEEAGSGRKQSPDGIG